MSCNFFVSITEELLPCPTSFRQMSVDDQFVPDTNPAISYFHPGSTSCFRSRAARYAMQRF